MIITGPIPRWNLKNFKGLESLEYVSLWFIIQIIPDEIDAKFHQTLPTQYMMQQLFNSKLAKKSTALFSKIRSNSCKTIDFLKEFDNTIYLILYPRFKNSITHL